MKLLLSLHSKVGEVYKTWSYYCLFTLTFGEVYKTWSYYCLFTLRFGGVYKTWSYYCLFTLRFGEVYKIWSYYCLFTLRFGEVYKSWDSSPLTLLVSRTFSKAVPSPTVRYKCRWISKSHPVRASRAGYLVTLLNYNAALYSRSEHTLCHSTADQSTHCGTV